MMKLVFIGSGNVATHLAKALEKAGNNILQIYSRSPQNAAILSASVNAEFTSDLAEINTDADAYIFSVKDDAIADILPGMPQTHGIWLHTAGSVSLDVFAPYTSDYGVMYPLQTFTKHRNVRFSEIPLFLEASNKDTELKLNNLANSISENVQYLSSEKRQYLHLSAVFACNFTNHMYALASEILATHKIAFEVLKPLIKETAAKITDMSPRQAQTGPAVRFDQEIMEKQIQLLKDESQKNIYRLLSENIHKYFKND